MSGVKLNWKAIFFPVIAFVFVFIIALATMASYVSGSIRNPNDKIVLDYYLSSNLPVARYNQNNSWYLESTHAMWCKSHEDNLTVTYAFCHGWFTGGEGCVWTMCDAPYHSGTKKVNNDETWSATKNYWAYTEIRDIAQYTAIANNYIYVQKGAWRSNNVYAPECVTVFRQ